MTLFAKQLKKKAEEVRMSTAERRDLKERLISYMEYHPLPERTAEEKARKYLEAEQFRSVSIRQLFLNRIVLGAALFIFIIVPIVAERAVPGDVLYPVKVRFNEEVRGYLALSPYEKVEWETRRLERRISEARLLAKEGKLTEEVEQQVADAVKSHTDAAEREIATIRESDEDGAALAEITFESALAVQSDVLKSDEDQREITNPGMSTSTTDAIVKVVDEARARAKVQSENNTLSFETLFAKIEGETTTAYEFFSTIAEVATDEEVKSIERRLADIERKIERGIVLHEEHTAVDSATGTDEVEQPEETEVEEDPRTILKSALSDIKKLISFMTDIDVRTSVDIDELLPVELTEEEKREAIKDILNSVTTDMERVTKALTQVKDISVAEKLSLGVDKVLATIGAIETNLESGDLDVAHVRVKESRSLTDELLNIVKAAGAELADPVEEVQEPEETEESENVLGGDDSVRDDGNAASSTDTGVEDVGEIEDEGEAVSTETDTASDTETEEELGQ